jgi:3-mercaptopyruvate sulfurtransferase SseA
LIVLLLVTFAAPIARAVTINLEKTKKTMPVKKSILPIILDARPAFAYATSHIPTSVNIRWKDYAQTDAAHLGNLDPDVDLLARKLRINGITPQVPVIVLGSGPSGDGAEGRVAWMLQYLGVQNVEIKNYDKVPGKREASDELQNLNSPIWLPKIVESLKISKRDLQATLNGKIKAITLIDVREPDEFVRKAGAGRGHIKGAINISWKEFFGKEGEPLNSDNVVGVLRAHQVDVSNPVIFYSNLGVRSGFITFLAAKAKLVARNYDGSFNEWSSDANEALE